MRKRKKKKVIPIQIMVDINKLSQDNKDGKLKTFMGRTPDYLKSKFLSVLGSSNDLINGISNRLDLSLSLSTSSDTETENNEYENHYLKRTQQEDKFNDDESIDENIIDFESRKVKERRAHEEVLSGKYRNPNFVAKMTADEYNMIDMNNQTSVSLSSSNYSNSLDSKSPNGENECTNNAAAMVIMQLEAEQINDDNIDIDNLTSISVDKINNLDVRHPSKLENISSATPSDDVNVPSISVESSDLKVWIRSESENSVPSWASSISLDSHTDEVTLAFMKKFIEILFRDSSSIPLDLKHEFGQVARTETGRLWFARLVSANRAKSKRVNETTFYSLIQYFAIVLFECAESDDFSPAKILMNMCFTFYHEVDVPGCEPYREYLYIYLREQQIWHSLRFWNAAFFDALQCERIHRPVPQTKNKQMVKKIHKTKDSISNVDGAPADGCGGDIDKNGVAGGGGTLLKNERNENNTVDNDDNVINTDGNDKVDLTDLLEDQEFQRNISFGQLGSFTCNMHAFGLSRELCTDFLRKQCTIANLNKDQEKMLRDNINRMYKETAKWRE